MPDSTTQASDEEQVPAKQADTPPEFKRPPLDMRWAPEVDLDRDMFISGIDLALMAADFARSCP